MTGKYRGLDLDEGWQQRRFVAIERELAELRAARKFTVVSDMRQANLDPAALTTSWAPYLITPVTPPAGYNTAIVQMLATAGVSFGNTGGNVGVQPCAGPIAGIGQSNGRPDAPGGGAGLSVTLGLSAKFAVTPGVAFNLYANAYANGAWTAGTGNVRFSAIVLYLRE